MTELVSFRFQLNGEERAAQAPDRLLLSDFIRHELRLTGTHVGCEIGVCGACTVIVNGEAVRSCLMFAAQLDGGTLETIEGAGGGPELNALQRAFMQHHALQCGYCTPGILMSLAALARQGGWPSSEEEIRTALGGNLCRCTGYQNIVDAVLSLKAEDVSA